MGFDYGSKKIGVAVGNKFTKITTPLLNLRLPKQETLFKNLDKIVLEWRPFMFIIGMPELKRGGDHPLKSLIEDFKYQLETRYKKPVFLIDEKLSSHEASKIKGQYEKNKSLDSIAASLIIDTWIQDFT